MSTPLNLAQELDSLFPVFQFPASSSLKVNNLVRKLTWFGRPPNEMLLEALKLLIMSLPLHQLKDLLLDCIPLSLPSNHLPTPGSGQDPVSLTLFKKFTSLTSLSSYGPDVDTFKCMNHSPDILPALKTLQILTPRVNYYEHSLSFWQERARMPGSRMLERSQLTLPMCAKGRAEAFLQRKEVFAKTVVLDYMHPPDQDVEMEEDDSDETDDEETGESEDSGGEMDEDWFYEVDCATFRTRQSSMSMFPRFCFVHVLWTPRSLLH
ncbi:hypothetical protein EV421DRAFT_962099 [Armillaria borealis]|uniref:Uncharacterized protein n=1 Tax=Armillaria borealis TaxID=47425 RepID=A0AA39J980_9AGAR|nr:hypothetical protein EV421DRAFT_962099 [Armillaria borealis]